MRLNEEIVRIKSIMGLSEQVTTTTTILPTSVTTTTTVSGETNGNKEVIDVRGGKLKQGASRLFNKIKTGIFKGAKDVTDFLKKMKGNKKTDVKPDNIEPSQDGVPLESETVDTTQTSGTTTTATTVNQLNEDILTEAYTNDQIAASLVTYFNKNSSYLQTAANTGVSNFLIPLVNAQLDTNVNGEYSKTYTVGVWPAEADITFGATLKITLEKFTIDSMSAAQQYKTGSKLLKFTVTASFTIYAGVYLDSWLSTRVYPKVSITVYIDPSARNIQLCVPTIKIYTDSIDIGIAYIKVENNKLIVYNNIDEWSWDLPIQEQVNNGFGTNPKVLTLKEVSPVLDTFFTLYLNELSK